MPRSQSIEFEQKAPFVVANGDGTVDAFTAGLKTVQDYGSRGGTKKDYWEQHHAGT